MENYNYLYINKKLNMSEELNITEQQITEQYKFIPENNEHLIMDKPSEPLIVDVKKDEIKIKKDEIKKEIKKKEVKEVKENIKEDIKIDFSLLNKNDNMKVEQKTIVKSNKELYESYINELKFFSLSLNNVIIYDSSIEKSKETPVKFENDFFILYGKKYSYNGLKIQKINKK